MNERETDLINRLEHVKEIRWVWCFQNQRVLHAQFHMHGNKFSLSTLTLKQRLDTCLFCPYSLSSLSNTLTKPVTNTNSEIHYIQDKLWCSPKSNQPQNSHMDKQTNLAQENCSCCLSKVTVSVMFWLILTKNTHACQRCTSKIDTGKIQDFFIYMHACTSSITEQRNKHEWKQIP